MKKHNKVDLLRVQDCEKIKLIWKIKRQVQQELLEKKLISHFFKIRRGHAEILRYPEIMNPLIEDFMQRAEEETKRLKR